MTRAAVMETRYQTLLHMEVFPNTLTFKQACQTNILIPMRCRTADPQLQKKFIHCKSSVTDQLWFTGVPMVLYIHWNKLSNSPVCDVTRNLPLKLVSPHRKLQANCKILPSFPPNFGKKTHTALIVVLAVSVDSLLLLWSSPEERVCLPERVCTESGEEVVTSSQSWRRSE